MNRKVLVLVAMITAFAPLSMDLYLPGLPDLRDELGASDAVAHLTVTACIVGLALGQLVAGLLSERLGRKAPLVVGMVLWVLATVACAFVPSIWTLTGLRLCQGLGAGVAVALARTIIADLDPDRLAEHISRMMLVLSVVPVLAPAIGGVVLAFTSWRGLFVALAGVGVLLLLVVRSLLPESRPVRDVYDSGSGFREIGTLLRKPAFLLPAVISGAGFGVMFSYIGDSAFVFRDHYDMGPVAYGLLFGANASALISGFQLGPALRRRWGTRRVLLVASAVGAGGGSGMVVVALAVPSALILVVLTLMVTLLSAGILVPLATAAAIDAHPENVGSASGLAGALQFLLGGTFSAVPVALNLGDGALTLGAGCTACLVGGWLLVALFLRDRDELGELEELDDLTGPGVEPAPQVVAVAQATTVAGAA